MSLLRTIGKNSVLVAQASNKVLIPRFTDVIARRGINATPPRIRVSFAEKVVHGLVLTVGVIAIPSWIIFHMEDYRNGNSSV